MRPRRQSEGPAVREENSRCSGSRGHHHPAPALKPEKNCHSEAGVFCLGRFYPPSQNRHDCGLFVVNGFAVLWERRFFISCNHRPRKESAMNSVFEAMGGTYRQGRSAEIADRPFSEGTFL